MRGGRAGPHGEGWGWEPDALAGPPLEIGVGRGLDTEVVAQLGVDVDERRRELHAVLHGEAQAMGLAGTVIRILPEQYDTSACVRRQMEGREDLVVWREHGMAGAFVGDELLQFLPV